MSDTFLKLVPLDPNFVLGPDKTAPARRLERFGGRDPESRAGAGGDARPSPWRHSAPAGYKAGRKARLDADPAAWGLPKIPG